MPKLVPRSRGLQALEKLREKYTQQQLADLTGLKQPTISQIETRERLPGLDGALGFEKVGINPKWWKERPLKDADVSQSPSRGGGL